MFETLEFLELVDVVICGGGLAGLTLARQLKLKMPNLSVLLIDRLARPLPESTLKVGESSVEVGGHYLADKLQLTDYFNERHLFKCGLRYFFAPTSEAIEKRPEFGLSKFPVVHSYQIDRGLLENDLREMNAEAGVTLLEGARVKKITLAEDDEPHEVLVDAEGEARSIKARWVVDASGRARILQRKLKLNRARDKNCSSAWFRYKGRVDIGDLVSSKNTEWHDRVPGNNRYYSTNHLMGEGYWVWLIPLGSGNTSVGIVTDDQIHPFETYKSYDLSLQWLRKHEPVLAEHLAELEPMDFLALRRYSYTSSQVFSHNRWACVGEAGVFADPFYSPGSDLIGFANTITTHMIELDAECELTEQAVSDYNDFVIGLNNALTHGIQLGYPLFGKPTVSAAKLIWDNTAAWSFVCPQMFNSTFLDAGVHKQIRSVTAPFFALTTRIQQLLQSWAEKTTGRMTFEFIDYLSIPYLHSLRLRNLKSGKSVEELIADQEQNMERVEELAQAIFLLAVEDTMPERLDELREAGWLNAWRIGLDPERWEADKLFQPRTEPRDLEEIYGQVRSLFSIDPAHAANCEAEETADMEQT